LIHHHHHHHHISKAWQSIRGNTKVLDTDSPGYYELKHHKPRFDEVCWK